MELSSNPGWRYIAVGGACVVAIASVAYLRHRRKTLNQSYKHHDVKKSSGHTGQQPASKHAQSTPHTRISPEQPTQDTNAKPNVGWENVEAWAAGLKKKNTTDLELLIDWTERILQEQPTHKALPLCLKALALLVGGHREADRVSAICLKASTSYPEQALEVLSAVFKDSRQREGFVADPAVVDFTLHVLKQSLADQTSRSSHQRACRLFDWLALEPANREILVSHGGCSVLLEVMEKFHDDPGVLIEGIASLQHLSEEKSLNKARATSITTACLEKFLENGELQWRALAALHAFPVPGKKERATVVKAACAASVQHPCFDAVIEWTAKLLYKLAVSDPTVLDEVRSRKEWLEKFRSAPLNLRKSNKQAEHWVSEFCKLCA